MRILNLKIKNIASIDEAEIDFVEGTLGNHSLFLITGETGSGKSTILDAMCLALYGDTPRLAATSKSEKFIDDVNGLGESFGFKAPETLLRKDQQKGESALTFEGIDGNVYTVRWRVERGVRSGKINAAKRSLINCTQANSVEEDFKGKSMQDDFVEHVVGLTFEQFCRTTILAQGDFTKFLKSDTKDKASILEKITGTDIYTRIGKRIYELYKEQEQKAKSLKIRLENISILSPDDVAATEVEIEQKNNAIAEAQAENKRVEEQQTWLTEWTNCSERLKNLTSQRIEIEKQMSSDEFRTKAADIELWSCSEELRASLQNLEKSNIELQNERAKTNIFHSQYLQALGALAFERKIFGDNDKQTLTSKFEELQNAINLKINEITALSNEINALSPDETTKRIKQCADAAKYAELVVEKEKNLSELDAVVQKTVEAIKQLQHNVQEANNQHVTANNAAAEQKNIYEKVNEQMGYAKAIMRRLAIGDECPVCHNKITAKEADEHFDAVVEPIKKAKDSADAKATAALQKLKGLDAELEGERRNYNAQETKLKSAKSTLDDCKKTLAAQLQSLDLQNVSALTTFSSALSVKQEQIEAKRIQIDALNAEINKLRMAANGVGELLQRATSIENMQAKQDRILQLARAWSCVKAEPKQIENATKLWENLEKEVENWSSRVTILNEQIAETNSKINNFYTQNQKIQQSHVESMLQRYTLSGALIIKQLRAEVDKSNQQLSEVKKRISELEGERNKLETSRPQIDDHATNEGLKEKRKTLEASIIELSTSLGVLVKKLSDNQENIKTTEAFRTQLEDEETLCDKWKILNNTFGSSDGSLFRTIAQSYILGELLNYANDHLHRLTGDRFQLEAPLNNIDQNNKNLSILVRDAYNGGALLTPANLSGGESFMVSLALALGLASFSNQNNASADIIFIDEGFGTLDGTYLDRVMNMLERLKETGGRRVGIISHVPELKERIPAQIIVEKTNRASSSVRVEQVF